jgi:hypothetical protein
MSYTLKSLKHTAGARRAVIAYHELVANSKVILDDAFRAVTGGETADAQSMDAACRSIQPNLHRNRIDQAVPADAPEAVRALWDLCCQATLDPTGLCAGAYDERIKRLDSEYEFMSTCFGEPEPPHCQVVFFVNGGKSLFASPALPTGRWNEVDIEVTANPSTTLLGMLYPMPANVYVRNARWDESPVRIRAAGDTFESAEGNATRFSVVVAPPQVAVRTPLSAGPYRLRMEVFVEMNIFTTIEAVSRQTQRSRNLEAQVGALNEHAVQVEKQILQLNQEIARLRSQR